MKNSKEMAERVMKIRDVYWGKRSIKKIILKTAAIVFVSCFIIGAVLIAFVMRKQTQKQTSADGVNKSKMVNNDNIATSDYAEYDKYVSTEKESVYGELLEDNEGKYLRYIIDTDGNEYEYELVGSHYGYFSSTGFTIDEHTQIHLSCQGMKSAPATLYLYWEESNSIVETIDLDYNSSDHYVSLMPGRYYIKVVSKIRERYSFGKIEIRGISDVYEKSLDFTKKA